MAERGFKQPSAMVHSFRQVPTAEIQRSAFKRSRGYKGTFDVDYIYPIFFDEALPGDTFNVRLQSIIRLSTPLHPIMDNLHVDYFFFYVPNRLLWDNWQKFCGERVDPADSIDYTVPQLDLAATSFSALSLGDYFGLPVGVTGLDINSLHFRAYNSCYNHWFRDENLIDSVVVDTDDGPDTLTDYVLLKRGKRHDYFTSALPWPQKVAADAVDLPLGSSAPVVTGADNSWDSGNTTAMKMFSAAAGAHPASYLLLGVATDGEVSASSSGSSELTLMQPENLHADLSDATAATINSLREAFQLQRMLERDARGGTRYAEILQSHFRVESPDHRLQRPEYLGGGTAPVVVSPIAQTSMTSGTAYQGDLAAVAYSHSSGIGFSKAFVEHGVILGLMNVRADLTYQDGVDRMWSRQTRYDFYWPALAHLGEQSILKKEIYAVGTSADDDVWAYQERWAEYRYGVSKIVGQMRSDHATSLDAWHLSQDLAACPSFNQSFIEEAVPIDRVVASATDPPFIGDLWFDVTCVRPMPTFSVPGLIDHF